MIISVRWCPTESVESPDPTKTKTSLCAIFPSDLRVRLKMRGRTRNDDGGDDEPSMTIDRESSLRSHLWPRARTRATLPDEDSNLHSLSARLPCKRGPSGGVWTGVSRSRLKHAPTKHALEISRRRLWTATAARNDGEERSRACVLRVTWRLSAKASSRTYVCTPYAGTHERTWTSASVADGGWRRVYLRFRTACGLYAAALRNTHVHLHDMRVCGCVCVARWVTRPRLLRIYAYIRPRA